MELQPYEEHATALHESVEVGGEHNVELCKDCEKHDCVAALVQRHSDS